jgi:hypothetical protein
MKIARLLPIAPLLVGCGNHFTPSPHMADAAPSTITPAPDAATLVFVRPSLYAGILNPSVFVDGKYVGDVEAGRQVVVAVPPGPHVVVAGTHDSAKFCRELHAEVAANKIYFIESTVAMGPELFAVRPSTDTPRLKEWLTRAPLARKLADPTSPMDAAEQKECSAAASEHAADLDPEDKAKRTIGAGDGFTAVP